MTYEYETRVQPLTLQGNGVEPAGIAFETIELQSRLFGNWAPDSVPEKTIRDELAKAIADEIVYDVDWSHDPRSGHSIAKYSTVVYMKPSLRDMQKSLSEMRVEILNLNARERETLKNHAKEIKELTAESSAYLEKYMHYMDKYYEYLGKDNDWKRLIKRGVKLWWLNLKCEVYSLARFIPFRDN